MRDLRFDRNLRRALGDEHVRPEVAEAARAAAAANEIEKSPADSEVLEAGNVVVAELRAVDVIDRRHVNRRPVAERAFAARRPPSPSDRRRGNDADQAIERDQRGKDGNPSYVILRRIDRIDDPSPRRIAASAKLLAEDAVVRPL